MKQIVVGIFDRGISAYTQVIHVPHVGVAIRGFTDAVNNGDSDISKHSGDFELRQLGAFDTESGKFENQDEQVLLVTGNQVKSIGVNGHGKS